MKVVIELIVQLLYIVTYVIIAQAIMSWLLSFNVINLGNRAVATIWSTLNQLTEPILRPIRNMMPRTGALDLSPLVLIFGIIFIQNILMRYVWPAVP